MQKITSVQLKSDIKQLGTTLKKCMTEMMSPKQCLAELKKIDPEMNKLLQMIKDKIVAKVKSLKDKIMKMLQKLKDQLISPTLKNIVQTVMNLITPPPSSRRRKRSSQIMSMIMQIQTKPLTKQDIMAILKAIKQAIMNFLMMPPPPPPPSIMQMLVNLAAKAVPSLIPLLSNPSLMKVLKTVPPPPSSK
jgi:ElaB/YqjD/DUF883 family membrane-anchored ribosome-binding protein